MSAMVDGEVSLLIPKEPDREIQANIEASTENCCSGNATCQVELRANELSNWTIHSRDVDGHFKSQGGDEYYICYEEHSESDGGAGKLLTCQAVALLQDRKDGSYVLDFVTTPMQPALPPLYEGGLSKIKGVFTVYFEYTNGIGQLPPPEKKDWPNGGYTHRCYSRELSRRPPIRPFSPPPCTVDLGSFDRIIAFGDSTMDQFVRQRPNKKGKYYFHPNLLVAEKVRHGLNSGTLQHMLELLEQDFGDMARRYAEEGESVCLVLGSSLWDILDASDTLQGTEYEDHVRACREYLIQVRQRYQVTVVWKSPMAVHVHWVDLQRLIEHDKEKATLFGRDRVRYMSSSRSKSLYDKQRRLMKELGVPLLDIFEASYLSADQLYPSDGRHYRPDLNRLMLGWFSPNASRNEKYYQNVP
jgi:hypothetical protein